MSNYSLDKVKINSFMKEVIEKANLKVIDYQ